MIAELNIYLSDWTGVIGTIVGYSVGFRDRLRHGQFRQDSRFDMLAAFRPESSEEPLEKSVEKITSINGITASETLISFSLPENL
ncbi:MAG TPA: hypothetical protein VGS11_12385 [Candidatus Bathyarchaeia archaeon]|nr:hypothetical protein [Candidatus Bathyarchaeia archaeon]